MDQILELIDREWPQRRVLVVGDVMLDKYIWGDVERISPEAPVPVVRAVRHSQQPGGAANVAMNLAGLGAKVHVIGFAAEDEDGQRLRALLHEANVRSTLFAVPNVPTISKLRISSGSQQMLRLDVERGFPVPQDLAAQFDQAIEAGLDGSDALILSDYAKGALTEQVCRNAIAAARRHRCPALVDPKHLNFDRYRGATTISPNLAELSAALKTTGRDLDFILQSAREFVRELDLEYLVATLGEKGIAVLREDNVFMAPAVARQVFDVSGAGDTVISVLALCLASGIAIEVAVRVANAAAGVVVSKIGTVPIQKEELLAALSSSAPSQRADKVLSLDRLIGRVAGWRASGQKIAFTNGCFDLLHVGHIEVLEQARAEADRLIVGMNSDTSVQMLKGPSRPVVAQAQRAQVLAALAAVDAVVLFGEPTPIDLIEAIRPDVLVKGGDYTESTIVGAPEVRSWGGRVKVVPTIEGFSSTNLIAKLS